MAGCAPLVEIQNNTPFAVRVAVTSGGSRQVVSPSAGSTSSAEVVPGPYSVSVVPDAEWMDYARTVRTIIGDYAFSAQNLTPDQVFELAKRLADINSRIDAYEKAGVGGNGCSGRTVGFDTSSIAADPIFVLEMLMSGETGDMVGEVVVNTAADGSMVAVCSMP